MTRFSEKVLLSPTRFDAHGRTAREQDRGAQGRRARHDRARGALGLTIESLRFYSLSGLSTDGITLQGDSVIPKQSHMLPNYWA